MATLIFLRLKIVDLLSLSSSAVDRKRQGLSSRARKQTEDCKSYFPEIVVEQIEDVAVEQTEDSESYFPEVAVEQIEAINYRSYLAEVAVEQIIANLISLKLQ
ncbi:Uncharacterized protein F383_26051 [Gossypium arboreum]|uniref:Uncharacterized protein n=1 Tax=Gossypium arboreum TaxID=29729 RepID=A0A0B0P6A0_GOSAR|nr:Uncharacterized protein F383_26051 [Gossypium arboreum]